MNSMALAALVPILILGVLSDIGSRRISNRLVMAGCLVGLTIAGWHGAASIFDAIAGLALGMLLLLPMYAAGGMAAGDVKFMGMVGLFLGLQATAVTVLYVFAAGGFLVLPLWLARRWRSTSMAGRSATSREHGSSVVGDPPKGLMVPGNSGVAFGRTLPYAVAIAAGVGVFVFRQ